MESSLSQLNPCNSTACLSLNNPPFKLIQNTKLRSLLMAKVEKVLGVSHYHQTYGCLYEVDLGWMVEGWATKKVEPR